MGGSSFSSPTIPQSKHIMSYGSKGSSQGSLILLKARSSSNLPFLIDSAQWVGSSDFKGCKSLILKCATKILNSYFDCSILNYNDAQRHAGLTSREIFFFAWKRLLEMGFSVLEMVKHEPPCSKWFWVILQQLIIDEMCMINGVAPDDLSNCVFGAVAGVRIFPWSGFHICDILSVSICGYYKTLKLFGTL